MGANAFQGFIVAEFPTTSSLLSDADLDAYVSQSGTVALHAAGTAAMSARNANYGVVDPDLRVKDATGLRVVDASIMPFLPSAHTQVPVYVLAERAADLIKLANII